MSAEYKEGQVLRSTEEWFEVGDLAGKIKEWIKGCKASRRFDVPDRVLIIDDSNLPASDRTKQIHTTMMYTCKVADERCNKRNSAVIELYLGDKRIIFIPRHKRETPEDYNIRAFTTVNVANVIFDTFNRPKIPDFPYNPQIQ